MLQFTGPQTLQRMFEHIGRGLESSSCNRGTVVEADAIREQQLKWTQSGNSSRSGCIRGAAAEVDASGEQQWSQTAWRTAAEIVERE